jgi:hypothetical protein
MLGFPVIVVGCGFRRSNTTRVARVYAEHLRLTQASHECTRTRARAHACRARVGRAPSVRTGKPCTHAHTHSITQLRTRTRADTKEGMHYLQTHTRTDTQTRTHTKGPDNPENKGTGNRHKRFENTRLGVAARVLLRRRARGLHVEYRAARSAARGAPSGPAGTAL